MGQRLNIEIHHNGTPLANSYYHWSGYTRSALALTQLSLEQEDLLKEAEEFMLSNPQQEQKAQEEEMDIPAMALLDESVESNNSAEEKSAVLYAIKLLEATGARVTKEEIQYARSIGMTTEFVAAVDRNDGLIAFSQDGMEETRSWEEARVVIDIGTKEISPEIYFYSDLESYAEETDESPSSIPEWNFAIDPTESVPFEHVGGLYDYINQAIKSQQYNLRYKDDEGKPSILGIIE